MGFFRKEVQGPYEKAAALADEVLFAIRTVVPWSDACDVVSRLPSPRVLLVESQVAFGGEARELGRYGAATQLAKRGGSTWTLKTCNDAINRSKKRKKEICHDFQRHTFFEKVWNLSLFSFEKCLNIAGNIWLSFPKLFLAFSRFEESHQDGHWHLARICKTCFDVFSCAWLKSRFGWIFNIWVKLIYLRQTRSCSRILLFRFQKDWRQVRFWLRLLMMIMQFSTMRDFRCLNEALLRFSGLKLQNARN